MQEKTKRKLLGKRFYAIYRRLRYMRFVKKKLKHQKKLRQLEKKQEEEQFRLNIRQQKKLNRELTRQKAKQIKLEKKLEKKAIRADLKKRSKLERSLEKQKAKELLEEQKKEQREIKERIKQTALIQKEEQKELKRKRKLAKKNRKSKIRKLRPYLFKRRQRELMLGIKGINKQTMQRWFLWFVGIAGSKINRGNFIKVVLNSMSLFILSYFALFIIGKIITIWVALSFDYKLIVYYFKLYYNIDSDLWTGDAVKILYSIQPITGLILGFVSLIIYNSKKNDPGKFKLFFLWGFVHGMVFFFGSLLMGTLLNKGFGWVIAYLYYKDTGKMIFSIISIFALAVTGSAIARLFVISGNTYFNFINRERLRFMIVAQTLLPAILGSIIISLMKIPAEYYYITTEEVWYEIIKLTTVLLVLIPMFFTFASIHDIYFDEEPRKISFSWWYLLATFSLFVLLIFGLQGGVEISPL